MKICLPGLAAKRLTLKAKGFTLIELLVACHPKIQRRKTTLGFTLIELLVVIGILTVLLAIVLVAINPARQFSQANDTQRRSDINAILNAVHQFGADNKGTLPAGITITEATICKGTGCPASSVDLCTDLVSKYLAELPRDPTLSTLTPSTASGPCATGVTDYNTAYKIVKTSSNRVTVTATPEITPPTTLSVTR